jgi:hypothetical protein
VAAAKGEIIVDAHGLKREIDYVNWLRGKLCVTDDDLGPPRIESHAVSREGLLRRASSSCEGLALNAFGQLVEPEFISTVTERCRAYINGASYRFQSSLLFSGRQGA